MQSKVFSTNKTLSAKGHLIDLSTPQVMGILNITPDSFYDGGNNKDEHLMLKHAEKMIAEGCSMIDIGGHSTRPGADFISPEEELNRVIPAIRALQKKFPRIILSVDTYNAQVASEAVSEGASIINDISGGQLDESMFETIAKCKVPYVLTHSRGNPKTMAGLTSYTDLIKEIADYFVERIQQLKQLGVYDVIIDPGFGFAKTVEQNFELLNHLSYFKILEKPILVGISRKSMIWKTLESDAENSLNGTTVLNTMALSNGASILRVHDVKEAIEVVKLYTFAK